MTLPDNPNQRAQTRNCAHTVTKPAVAHNCARFCMQCGAVLTGGNRNEY